MKLNKMATAIILCIALILSLAACTVGNPENSGSVSSAAPASDAPSNPADDVPSDSPAAGAITITIASSNSGGAWYPIAGALADLFQKNIDGAVSSATGGAGISNIFSVASNEAQVGFGFPDDVLDAKNGVGDFEGQQLTNVKGLTALYPGVLHIAVSADSSIQSVEDLKGKTVCTQSKGNAAYKMTWKVLDAYGITENDLTMNYVGFTDAVDLIKDGHADALCYMSTFPYSALQDLAESSGVKLLEIDQAHMDQIVETAPAYSSVTIPGGTYKGTDEDVNALGCTTILFTNDEMPEDVVYQMTKLMFENHEDLVVVNSSLSNMTPEFVVDNIGIEFHPGAEKYFREIGALSGN